MQEWRRKRGWELICLLLFFILAGYQVFVPPVTGLANNSDFVYVLGKLSICPVDREKQDNIYLVTDYFVDPVQCTWDTGLVSTEVPLAMAARYLSAPFTGEKNFDLRALAALHLAVLLLAFGVLLSITSRAGPAVRYGIPIVFILIFSDVAYTCYLNSVYLDAPAFVFLVATTAMAAAAFLDHRSRWVSAGYAVCGAALAFSKSQHAILGLVFAALAVVLSFRPARRTIRIEWAAVAALLAGSAMAMFSLTTPKYRIVPLYNVIFSRLVPHSDAPWDVLKELGLGDEDLKYMDSHAYVPGAPLYDPAWSENFLRRTSFGRLMWYYLRNPDVALTEMNRDLTHAATIIRPKDMANYREKDGFPPRAMATRFSLWSTLRGAVLNWFPYHVLLIYLAPWVAALAAWKRPGLRSPLLPLAVALSVAGAAEFTMAALTDALDNSRHLFIFQVTTELLILMIAAALLHLANRWRVQRKAAQSLTASSDDVPSLTAGDGRHRTAQSLTASSDDVPCLTDAGDGRHRTAQSLTASSDDVPAEKQPLAAPAGEDAHLSEAVKESAGRPQSSPTRRADASESWWSRHGFSALRLSSARSSGWEMLCFLALLGLVGYQLFLPPVTGLANNSDFIKALGPWSICSDRQPQNNRSLVTDYAVDPACQYDLGIPSIERPMVGVARYLSGIFEGEKHFDLRFLAALHLAILMLGFAVLLCLTRRAPPPVRYGIPALFILVFSDVAYTCYLNSAYMDAPACVLLIATASIAMAACFNSSTWLVTLGYLVAGLALVFSKSQHAVLGVFFAAVALVFAWRSAIRSRRVRWVAVALLLLGGIAAMSMLTSSNYQLYPLYSLVFTRLGPHAEAPLEMLQEIGLGAEDLPYLNTNSYTPGAPLYTALWAENFLRRTSFGDVLVYYLRHPSVPLREMDSDLRLAAPVMRPPDMPNFREQDGIPPGTMATRFSLWSNLRSAALHVFPYHVLLFYLAPWAAALAAWRLKRLRSPALPLALALSAAGLVEFAMSALTDAMDNARHLFLFHAITETLILLLAAALLSLLSKRGPELEVPTRPAVPTSVAL